MKVIICIDDDNGMMFGNRRQSRDRRLTERIVRRTAGRRLWMNSYSLGLFKESKADNIIADEQFLSKAEPGDFCFVENVDLKSYGGEIEKLIIYRWNRKYPSDMKFTLELTDWRAESCEDFEGFSHERITEEVWTK